MGDEDIREEGALVDPEESQEEPEIQESDAEEGEEAEETETEEAEESEEGAGEEGEDADDDSEPDPTQPVPYKRFTKTYGRMKELEREREELAHKNNLLKTLGPDKYYEIYPDERPQGQGEQPAQPAGTQAAPPGGYVPMMSECLDFVIQGGQYNGYTLRQLMESGDPTHQAAAYDHYNAFADSRKAAINAERAKQSESEQEIQQMYDSFNDSRAQEFFGKPAAELTDTENRQIHEIRQALIEKMESGEIKTWDLNTAYDLATKDDRIKTEKGKAIRGLVEAMRKTGGITHPETKTDGARRSGYESFLAYTDDQLADHLESLSDEACEKFWQKAPKALKRKFPKAAAAYG